MGDQEEGFIVTNKEIPEDPAESEDPSDKEDGTDNGQDADKDEKGKTLPKTATNIYNFLLIGAILLIAGAVTLFIISRRKEA